MSQKRLIKLIYYLNHEESTVSFDPDNKLSVLKTLINLTQKINIDSYDILYGKKRIVWEDDKPLKEFIGKDSVPVFYLKKKEFMVQPQIMNNPGVDYNSLRSNPNNSFRKSTELTKSKPSMTSPTQKCRIAIDYFPSRAEIYTMLDNFIDSNGYKKDYSSSNKGTGIEIIFNNSDIAYDFIKFINFEKMSNPLYKKIRTNLIFDSKNPLKMRGSQSPVNSQSLNLKNREDFTYSLNNNNQSFKNGSNQQNNEPETNIFSPIRLNSETVLSKSKNFSESRPQNLKAHSKARSMDMRSLDSSNVESPHKSIRISSPYVTENDQQFQAYLKNKEKWIDRRGIVPVIGRVKPSFIPNGINYQIPYGKPVTNHNFRDYYGNEVCLDDSKFFKNK